MRFGSLAAALLTVCTLGLMFAPPSYGVDVMATALVGPADQSYGVATIEVPLAQPIIGQTPRPITVTSDSGRIFYPIADEVEVRITPPSERPVPQPGNGRLLGRLGNLIRELTDSDAPTTQIVARRVSFLFSGSEPFQIRLADENQTIGDYQLSPSQDPVAFADVLTRWWNAYITRAENQINEGDYPPWVETYLVAMLSGRTGKGLPTWYVEEQERDDPLWATLKYLAGAEGVMERVFRLTAAGLNDTFAARPAGVASAAMRPLPDGPRWKESPPPNVDAEVDTEAIASRIPPECFYIRFGKFENYLWFLDLSQEYGGDIGRMVTLRGVEGNSTKRFEKQLSLQINQLTRMLGPTVIEDQAIIGRDLFTDDGATMGVLMKSTNAFLLRTSLGNDRSARASRDPDVSLKTIKIGGRDVSFLSSPDHSVRSFLVEDDGYFLITNSRTLAERFLQVGDDGKSLAQTPSFRLSRQLVPTSRDDTIFAYFSPQMLQGLVSPQYLIELRRRLAADSDIALVHLARLAAVSEGNGVSEGIGQRDADDLGVEQLIEDGFLPVSFGSRPDGSGVIAIGEQVIDTLRGARGTFLPIADVSLESVSQQEFDWYSQIAQEYTERFPQMDPIIVALRREEVPGQTDLERISVHAEIAPLTPEKYGKWAKQLGPPTRVSMRFAPDDIVTLQAHVASDTLGPPTHLFAGIKDTFPPEPEDFDGIFGTYRALRQLPAYLGAWPQPGALDRLPLGLGRGRPVGPGMSKLIGGLYRYTGGGFSVLSFQPEVLNSTLPFLEATEVDEAATVRGRVGSLLGSRLEGWVNNQLYQRAARSSAAGAEFLNSLQQQLHVSPENVAETAARVLGSPLQCSLGGEYRYDELDRRWVSTAWSGDAPLPVPPENYTAPLLLWFRGGEFTLSQFSDRLVADGVITVARREPLTPQPGE